MDSLRAAKENAAALENKGAAEGTRFEIKKDAEGETYIQIDEDILKGIPQENWKSVVKQAIRERFPDGFVRNGWTILNSKDISSVWMRPSLMPSTAAAPPCSLPPTMCTSGGAWPEKGGFEP